MRRKDELVRKDALSICQLEKKLKKDRISDKKMFKSIKRITKLPTQ